MARSNHPWLCVPLMLFAAAAGCGGDFQLGEVSGVVSLDGEPLSGASLYFQPQRQGEGLMVGPPSIGVTDERGHYTLKTSEGSYGAVVGPHKVSISTFESRMVDPKNSDRVETVSKERVPARYRAPSELTFTVSPSGSSEADFDLTTR